MKDLLKTHFGYDAFRPLQEEIMDTVLQKKDALVLMPTGGGKSLCYQLPALMMDGVTVVISPLIALMKDQVDALVTNGIAAAFLNSTLTGDEIDSIQFRALSGELKILYLAPERLASAGFQTFLRQLNVSFIAIDEAHCISEWGHDFRPDYRNLKDLRMAFPSVPVMALTATATPRVREDIVAQLGMQKASVFLSSFNRPNLHYSLRAKNNAFGQLVQLLRPYKDKPVIIYCFSRKDTESLAGDLCASGFQAAPYHAGLDRETRAKTQDEFIRDEVSIIVATIAFGMGIDKPDVRLVAHMDLPKTLEGYYQETGRAGRDGLPSDCVLFYSFGDKRKQDFFIAQIADEEERALANTKLNQVISYCESGVCRRKFLLQYFGEPWAEARCEACDNCVAPSEELRDTTEIAQKVLSAVLRTGEMFGSAYVCDVLRGSRKGRILENKHETLSVYGAARDVSADVLREVIRLLQKKGFLEKNEGDYPTLRVSRTGKQALVDRESIMLPLVAQEPARSKPSRAVTSGGLAFDPELFELLRRERKAIADEHNVPPFIIFGDRTLQEMAFYLPQTLDRLGDVFGVGARKLDEFGDAFLRVIKTYAEPRDLPERPHPKQADKPSNVILTPTRQTSTVQKTRELVEKKRSLSQMAVERNITEGTIIQHIVAMLEEGIELDIEYLRPPAARLTAIEEAFRSTNATFLSPIKAMLGDDYSYDDLRLARLFLSNES